VSIDKFGPYRFILASKSPRRAALLKELGLTFEVDGEDGIDEKFPSDLVGEDIAEYLALLKSKAYARPLTEKEILITADTIVWFKDHLLGKPRDEADARKILRELSGNTHQVFTGVCLRSANKKKTFVSATSVKFAKLSDGEINHYIQKYKPYDKAGAYGIQEWIGYIAVEEIQGSYFNVMGLPVQRVYKELLKFLESNLA
jgi:septum formation protein